VLIKNLNTDFKSKIIAETIVDFSKKIGKEIIAEFVHSKEIFDIVRAMGIDYAQGYYIAEPMPVLLEEKEEEVEVNEEKK